jgi:hypothetical protein
MTSFTKYTYEEKRNFLSSHGESNHLMKVINAYEAECSLPIAFYICANPLVDYEWVKSRYKKIPDEFSANPIVTEEFRRMHPDITYNLAYLLQNPNITYDYIKQNRNTLFANFQSFHFFAGNPNCTINNLLEMHINIEDIPYWNSNIDIHNVPSYNLPKYAQVTPLHKLVSNNRTYLSNNWINPLLDDNLKTNSLIYSNANVSVDYCLKHLPSKSKIHILGNPNITYDEMLKITYITRICNTASFRSNIFQYNDIVFDKLLKQYQERKRILYESHAVIDNNRQGLDITRIINSYV